jgi:hypothetical protein
VSGSTLYVVGDFTSIDSQPRSRIAALDAITGQVGSWNPNAMSNDSFGVGSVAVAGTTVYVAGTFTTLGGQPRVGLAALDATTALATSWNPGPAQSVSCLELSGGTVYVGGNFTSLLGSPHSSIAGIYDGTVSVDGPPVLGFTSALRATPNPFLSAVNLHFSVPLGERAEVLVYDLAGRIVRHLDTALLTPGDHNLLWDGRNDEARPVCPGLYVARVRGKGLALATKLYRQK